MLPNSTKYACHRSSTHQGLNRRRSDTHQNSAAPVHARVDTIASVRLDPNIVKPGTSDVVAIVQEEVSAATSPEPERVAVDVRNVHADIAEVNRGAGPAVTAAEERLEGPARHGRDFLGRLRVVNDVADVHEGQSRSIDQLSLWSSEARLRAGEDAQKKSSDRELHDDFVKGDKPCA